MEPTALQQLAMLRSMQTIRRFEERASDDFQAGQIYGVVHCYIGQEAVAVGVCSALNRDDQIISTHRGHGHCIAKGADLKRMMAELYGRYTGYCKGKGGSMHIADFGIGMLGANGIVAGGIPIVTGAGLAAQVARGRGGGPPGTMALRLRRPVEHRRGRGRGRGPGRMGGAGPMKHLGTCVIPSARKNVANGRRWLLGRLEPLLGETASGPERDAVVAVLNGVLGHWLERTGSPLALELRLRAEGAGPKAVVLVHGSSMNDLQWLRRGHDHGQALARDGGFVPVYVRYNSGLSIAENGRLLAERLEELEHAHEIAILGHSMGGLVARSACHVAEVHGRAWRKKLRWLVIIHVTFLVSGVMLAVTDWLDARANKP